MPRGNSISQADGTAFQSFTVFIGFITAVPESDDSNVITLPNYLLTNTVSSVAVSAEWTISCDAYYAPITITRMGNVTSTGPLWLSFVMSTPTVLSSVQTSGPAGQTFGLQGIAATTSTTPPGACFGAGTFVLCADGTLRDIATLTSPTSVMAIPPADDDHGHDHCHTIDVDVDVYFLDTTTRPAMVAQVAPGVFVTKDHSVCIPGRFYDDDDHHRKSHMKFKHQFDNCAWIAGTLPEFDDIVKPSCTGLFHLVPTNPLHTK